jgi:hypothetical protein
MVYIYTVLANPMCFELECMQHSANRA